MTKEQALKDYRRYEATINELKAELKELEKNHEPWEKQSKIRNEIQMYEKFQATVEHLSGCYHLEREL